jgi:hypothetical protein
MTSYKLKSWGKDAVVITCWRTYLPSVSKCELCDAPIKALPESIETGFHLICRECGLYLVDVKVMGSYHTSKEAKQSLPSKA